MSDPEVPQVKLLLNESSEILTGSLSYQACSREDKYPLQYPLGACHLLITAACAYRQS
jgi:hypothetical protein